MTKKGNWIWSDMKVYKTWKILFVDSLFHDETMFEARRIKFTKLFMATFNFNATSNIHEIIRSHIGIYLEYIIRRLLLAYLIILHPMKQCLKRDE